MERARPFSPFSGGVALTRAPPLGAAEMVPRDDRRPLKKAEFIAQHFMTRAPLVGHGVGTRYVLTGMGDYAFTHQRMGRQ